MTKYLIDDELVSKEVFYERLEEEVNEYVENNYDDILDECYPSYKMCGIEFYASQILSECDPVAYRCGLVDEQSYKLEEAKNELDSYDEFIVNGVHFNIEYDEEDDEEEDE